MTIFIRIHAYVSIINIMENKTVHSSDQSSEAVRKTDTNKLARLLIIVAAGISMALSVSIWFIGEDRLTAIFVGTWVPSILALGALIIPRKAQ